MSEKMTLAEVLEEMLPHVDGIGPYAEVPVVDIQEWSDAIESAIASRAVTDEDARKLGDDYFRLVKEAGEKGMAAGFWIKPLRAALEAYERNRK